MKIFAVSDLHSYFTLTKEALDKAGFEAGNSEHLLVVCGDCFDRGDESQKILDYLMSVPNKVLVLGNHEELLESCCKRTFAFGYDVSNGTHKTICDLDLKAQTFFDACIHVSRKVKPLLNQMVDYFETEHYVFVHSTIPLNGEWRKAHADEWCKSRWDNPFKFWDGVKIEGKTVVFGHWHTSWAWSRDGDGEELGPTARFDPYYGDGYIGIDACTAYSKQVNVLVLEDDLLQEEVDGKTQEPEL